MRFAWIKEQPNGGDPIPQSVAERLTTIAYNAIWWTPLLFVLIDRIDYEAGFFAFTAITIGRLIANIYRNNILPPERGVAFPLRI